MKKVALLTLAIIVYGVVLFIVIFDFKLYADSFFPAGNVEESKMHVAIGIEATAGTVNLPEWVTIRSQDPNAITLSPLLSGKTFIDITSSVGGVYRKTTGVFDSISTIPGSFVDIWLFPYNETGHVVGGLNSWLFLGPYQESTIADIVGVGVSVYRNIVYFEHGHLKTKGGESIGIGSLGNFQPISSGYALARRKIFSGQVKNPIDISEVTHQCPSESAPDKESLSFVLKNVGNLAEEVKIGAESIDLAPNEKEIFTKIAVNPALKQYDIGVERSVTRCLGRVRDLNADDPDNHALLLSRNDLNQWLWGGISVEVPPMQTGGLYCITRQPYYLTISYPECPILPKYSLQAPAIVHIRQNNPGKFEIVVANDGGDATANSELMIVFPKYLREKMRLMPDGVLETVDNEKLVWKFSVNPLKTGQQTAILGEISSFDEDNGKAEIQVKFGDVTRVITFDAELPPKAPDPEISIRRIKSRQICEKHKYEWQIDVEVASSKSLSAISLPLMLQEQGATGNKHTIEMYWTNGTGTYTLMTGEPAIVSFIGQFNQGPHLLTMTLSYPSIGRSDLTLAVGGVIATVSRDCPVERHAGAIITSGPPIASYNSDLTIVKVPTTSSRTYKIPGVSVNPSIPLVNDTAQFVLGTKLIEVRNVRLFGRRYFLWLIVAIISTMLCFIILPRNRSRK